LLTIMPASRGVVLLYLHIDGTKQE
jgi:hypothetical protein